MIVPPPLKKPRDCYKWKAYIRLIMIGHWDWLTPTRARNWIGSLRHQHILPLDFLFEEGRGRKERLGQKNSMVCKARSYGGAVKRAVASHQYGLGLNPDVGAICGLSLLLVLSFAPRGFSPGTLVFLLSLKTQHLQISIRAATVDEQPALWRCVTFKSSFVGQRRSCWK